MRRDAGAVSRKKIQLATMDIWMCEGQRACMCHGHSVFMVQCITAWWEPERAGMIFFLWLWLWLWQSRALPLNAV